MTLMSDPATLQVLQAYIQIRQEETIEELKLVQESLCRQQALK